jgi:predicted GNAT family acetyltransferase
MGGWPQWPASDYDPPNSRKSARCALIPNFAGRGYARDLTTFLAAQILAAGKTPFLHVKSENGAKVVYQKIGFRLRAAIYLTVISLR